MIGDNLAGNPHDWDGKQQAFFLGEEDGLSFTLGI